MGVKWVNLKVKQCTVQYIEGEVRDVFLDYHPEMRGVRLSREFLLFHALRYYVENIAGLKDLVRKR